MPCWVVPVVAAEYWGTSVERVLADVAAGRLETCTERDLLFVAVTPGAGPGRAPGTEHAPRPPGRRSLAWTVAGAQTVVTPDERDALLTLDDTTPRDAAPVETATDCGSGDDAGTPPDVDPPSSVHDDGEPAPLPDGPEEPAADAAVADEPPRWASVRGRVSRLRAPPPRTDHAAA